MSSSPRVTDAALRSTERGRKRAENELKVKQEKIAKIKKEIEDQKKALEMAQKKVQTQREKAEEVTECQICFNSYDFHLQSWSIPYEFECGHTFCAACVNKLFEEQYDEAEPVDRLGPMKIKCPTCNKVITVSDPMSTAYEHQPINNNLRTLLRVLDH